MKTKSAKAKGREFQNKVRDMYRNIAYSETSLKAEDIEGRQMGGAGVDIVFSPSARQFFNHDVECKKHRKVAVPTLFEEHFEKYKDNSSLKLLFHENDRSTSLVTLRAVDFIELLRNVTRSRGRIRIKSPEDMVREA